MKLNNVYTHEEFLTLFYQGCIQYKYLEDQEVKVLQAIVEICDEKGNGVLDIESLAADVKMNVDDVVNIINTKLLNKTLLDLLVLEIIDEKHLWDTTIYYIHSELSVCNQMRRNEND